MRAGFTARLLLLTCLLCPLSESLDVWHATLDGGSDTEFALVVAALSVGVGFVAVRLILISECIASVYNSVLAQPPREIWAFTFGSRWLRFTATGPPLLALRI